MTALPRTCQLSSTEWLFQGRILSSVDSLVCVIPSQLFRLYVPDDTLVAQWAEQCVVTLNAHTRFLQYECGNFSDLHNRKLLHINSVRIEFVYIVFTHRSTHCVARDV